MENYLIVVAGLPGTGKSTTARRLGKSLDNYELIEQNEIRRKMDYRSMPSPKEQEPVLEEINRLVQICLNNGKGVVVESAHSRAYRRHQLYGIASSCGAEAVALGCVCSEELSRRRIESRDEGDELISDPTDFEVYSRIKQKWENIEWDFLRGEQQGHVSHIRYDSEGNKIDRILVRRGAEEFVEKIEGILLKDI